MSSILDGFFFVSLCFWVISLFVGFFEFLGCLGSLEVRVLDCGFYSNGVVFS